MPIFLGTKSITARPRDGVRLAKHRSTAWSQPERRPKKAKHRKKTWTTQQQLHYLQAAKHWQLATTVIACTFGDVFMFLLQKTMEFFEFVNAYVI